MRIVFCGDVFASSRDLLRERLPPGANDEIVVWRNPADLGEAGRADVLIPMMSRIDAAVMDAVEPRLIQQWGSGLEGVDIAAARARGIAVANVPASGSNAESVAEHAILLMLALLRELPAAAANVRAGVLGTPVGRALSGATVCLYGLGTIALALARRLRGFDVWLIGITRDPAAPKVGAYSLDRCYSSADRDAAFRETDVLVVCLRLNAETRGIVGAEVFAALKPGAYLVNTGRGPLVDYAALSSALDSGRLAGAGLDVFWQEPISPEDPLLARPNVVATPHIAGVTDRSYGDIAAVVSANIERLRRGEAFADPR
jgi:phosphoglycerate dehydrogenase-like enzyme